jgi:3-phosphoshikimate 1-carboxyvinyltransferase
VSSQFITGLLFALSLLDDPSTLTLTGEIESAPYIDMTVRALACFGAAPKRSADGRVYTVAGKKAVPLLSPDTLFPEGDFSGAAFPLAAGAVGRRPVTVTGLAVPSLQGDSEILEILTRFGAKVERSADGITVSPAPMRGVEIDAAQIPDLVPILAVVAAAAVGETRIYGAERLRLKESDRLVAVTDLLKTLGADVTETPDGLIVRGGKPLHGGVVNAYGDHRIAMSAAVASLLTDEAVTIPHAECVGKSYPAFFDEVIFPTSREGA